MEWMLEFMNWARPFRIRCMGLSGWRKNRSGKRGKDDGGGESVVQTRIERKLVHMVGWSQGVGVTLGGFLMRGEWGGLGKHEGLAAMGKRVVGQVLDPSRGLGMTYIRGGHGVG